MGRNAEKNAKIRKEKENEIMFKALQYFAKYGYSGTKMSNLASGIGISSGLIYHYFSSKEELLEKIILNILENRDNELAFLREEGIPPKEKILRLTTAMKEAISDEEYGLAASFTLLENMNLISEDAGYYTKWSKPAIEALAQVIKEGQRDGVCHQGNSVEMAVSYWGLISSMSRDQLAVEHKYIYDYQCLNRMLLKEEYEYENDCEAR